MTEEIIVPKPRLERAKSFVVRHKVAIAVSTTAAVCLVLNRIALQQHETFIEEKGLMDEFQQVGEFEELV